MLAIESLLAFVMVMYLVREAVIFDIPRMHLLRIKFTRDLLACPICTGVWVAGIVVICPTILLHLLALAGVNLLYWKHIHDYS